MIRFLFLAICLAELMFYPSPGEIVSVLDGDTIEIAETQAIRIRGRSGPFESLDRDFVPLFL